MSQAPQHPRITHPTSHGREDRAWASVVVLGVPSTVCDPFVRAWSSGQARPTALQRLAVLEEERPMKLEVFNAFLETIKKSGATHHEPLPSRLAEANLTKITVTHLLEQVCDDSPV